MDSITAVKRDCFRLLSLPFELQGLILSLSLDSGVSPTCLACLSPDLHSVIVSLLHTHIYLPSIDHLIRFLAPLSGSRKYATQYARSFTFSIPGVPGGSTHGGRESAPGSPNASQARQLNNRLLLASQAIQLCPNLRDCSLEMFGVRHSSLLTSNDYIADETNAFRIAVSQLKNLTTFAWTTPKENSNFVGFSVAVVDLAFGPLIEGLEEAAIDMDLDGRRIARPKGDVLRYRHPLEEITLHHCIFPSNQGKHFFHLFAKAHPDDEDCLLFSQVKVICIKKAINVNPHYVAFLALFWQLLIDRSSLKEMQAPEWNPIIILEDVYVNSIWGPRLTRDLIVDNLKQLIESHLVDDSEKVEMSHNAYIRALEESVEAKAKLDQQMHEQLHSLQGSQRDDLIRRASERIKIGFVEGAIAGFQ